MKFETRELFRKYTDDVTFERIKEMDTIVEMLEECNKNYADQLAITDASGSYTFAQLYNDSTEIKNERYWNKKTIKPIYTAYEVKSIPNIKVESLNKVVSNVFPLSVIV